MSNTLRKNGIDTITQMSARVVGVCGVAANFTRTSSMSVHSSNGGWSSVVNKQAAVQRAAYGTDMSKANTTWSSPATASTLRVGI